MQFISVSVDVCAPYIGREISISWRVTRRVPSFLDRVNISVGGRAPAGYLPIMSLIIGSSIFSGTIELMSYVWRVYLKNKGLKIEGFNCDEI